MNENRVTGAAGNELAQTLSALARSLQAEPRTDTMLGDFVTAAVAEVPGADEASITIIQGRHRLATQIPSSPLPALVDALQVQLGQGPCLDAAREERVVHVPDLRNDTRWPEFARRAADAGVGSMLILQLWVQNDTLGTLNLYARRPHAFDEESEQIGLLFVSHAAVAMAGARALDQLTISVDTRDLIGQAKGMLMERYRIDDAAAFALLVRTSQTTNTKLRAVAAELIATRLLTTAAPQEDFITSGSSEVLSAQPPGRLRP